jgi:hypothetical protein
MTTRTFVCTIALAALAVAPALAQPPATPSPVPRTMAPAPVTAPPAAAAPSAPPTLVRQGQPVNVRLDVTITDQQRNGATALKKTVSIVTADGMGGRIRSQANYINIGEVPLNVDAEPEIMPNDKVRVRVNLQYDLPASGDATGAELTKVAGPLRKTQIQENLALILENGKPLVAAQSADPVGDRQVTVEVKATILR